MNNSFEIVAEDSSKNRNEDGCEDADGLVAGRPRCLARVQTCSAYD